LSEALEVEPTPDRSGRTDCALCDASGLLNLPLTFGKREVRQVESRRQQQGSAFGVRHLGFVELGDRVGVVALESA
jgi:hypothetical protein